MIHLASFRICRFGTVFSQGIYFMSGMNYLIRLKEFLRVIDFRLLSFSFDISHEKDSTTWYSTSIRLKNNYATEVWILCKWPLSFLRCYKFLHQHTSLYYVSFFLCCALPYYSTRVESK